MYEITIHEELRSFAYMKICPYINKVPIVTYQPTQLHITDGKYPQVEIAPSPIETVAMN